MNASKLTFGATVAVLALGLCTYGWSTAWMDTPVDGVVDNGSFSGSGPRALTAIAHVGKASSFDNDGHEIETVIQCCNDDAVTRTVEIHWVRKGIAGNSDTVGISALAVSPGESRTFSTANASESVDPFVINAFRDLTSDFVGRAVIFSDPEGFRGLTFQAFQVSGIGQINGLPEVISDIPVYRVKDGSEARQAGD